MNERYVYKYDILSDFEEIIKEKSVGGKTLIVCSGYGKKSIFKDVANILTKYNNEFRCFNDSNIMFVDDGVKTQLSQLVKTKYNIVVGIGSGKTCDLTKFFSKNLNCESVFIPTTISCYSIYTNKIIVEKQEEIFEENNYKIDFILIDKNLIYNMDFNTYNDCKKFLFSLISCINEQIVFNKIFDKKIDYLTYFKKEILSVFSEEFSINFEDEKKKLFFDRTVKLLFQIFKLCDFSNCSILYLAIINYKNQHLKFCDCLINATIIMSAYSLSLFEIKYFFPACINLCKNDIKTAEKQVLLANNTLFFKKINSLKCYFRSVFFEEKQCLKRFLNTLYYDMTGAKINLENNFYIACKNKNCNGFLISFINSLGFCE